MTRHILGLFHGQPRARSFRRLLAERAHLDGAGLEVLQAARRIIADEDHRAIAANRELRCRSARALEGLRALGEGEQALYVEEARRLHAVVAIGAP